MNRRFYQHNFNFRNLSFLYIACLVSIAFVITLLRAGEFYLAVQESEAVKAVQIIDEQRDSATKLERLAVFVQNEDRSASSSVMTRQLLETYQKIQEANPQILDALQKLETRCLGRPCGDLVNRQIFPITYSDLEFALNDNSLPFDARKSILKQVYDSAIEYRIAIRDTLTLSLEIIRAKNENNLRVEIIGYLVIMVLLLAQALFVFRPAIRRLNASLATRNEFLSRISHEIRNPMNSILGMADILKTTPLNFEQRRYLDNLNGSGNALLEMLNNLVDVSVIETGRMQFKANPFDLFRSLDRCLNLVAIQAHHKNLNLYVHVDPNVPNKLMGDSVRLDQVLINLLNNACKFTEQGFVKLAVQVLSEDESDVALEFSVSDSGIGIADNQRREIFESFVQGDSSIQRKYGGAGLGLSISREIVRIMGGQLQVESRVGEGSRFSFTIMLNKRKSRRPVDHAKPLLELKKRKMYFVSAIDDQAAYDDFIRTLACDCMSATSPGKLRELLESHSKEANSVDEILVDDSVGIIAMITCRNFAAEFGLSHRTVAMVRSNFTKENMDLLRRNGYSRFLIKPLKPWELLSLSSAASATPIESGRSSVDDFMRRLKAKNLKILLVDDSDDNLFLMKEIVDPIAGQVHVAQNGLQGVEKFEQTHYDAVFMDIQMPVMDGYSAIRRMRELEYGSGEKIPIFAVTAHAGLVDAEKCQEAGFTERIVKPILRRDIYRSLARAFGMERAEPDPVVDHGFPKDFMKKLLPTYFRTRIDDLKKIKEALANNDYSNLQKLGHKVKGGAATYGFVRTSAFAQELERAAVAHDISGCSKAVAGLEESLQSQQKLSNV